MATRGTDQGVIPGAPSGILHVPFHESLHPPARDLTLDDNLPDLAHPGTDNTSHQPPTADLGSLEHLPLELLHMTVSYLDLGSLENFRRVNRRASQVVESYLPYKELKTHAPNLIRGALYIEAGPLISCQTVYEKLRTQKCGMHGCVNIGTYFHILACERVCHSCLIYDFPMKRSQLLNVLGLDQDAVERLPSVRARPGTYGSDDCPGGHDKWVMNESMVLVDGTTVWNAAVAFHGSHAAARTHVESFVSERISVRPLTTTNIPMLSRECRSLKALAFAVTVRMPWLDTKGGRLVG